MEPIRSYGWVEVITISKNSVLPMSLFILAALLRISPATSFLAYLVLCFLAFINVRGALWALVSAWFFSTLNPELFASGPYDSILRFAVIFAAAVRMAYQVFADNKIRRARLITIWVLLFGLFMLVHSVLFSQILAISILKASMWTLSLLTAVSGWQLLGKDDSDGLFRNIKQLSIIIAVVSLLLSFTSYGYTRNETGLNGILNHPQALGLISGIFMATFFAEMISSQHKNIMSGLAFVVFSVVLILTESRTGGLAFLLSVIGMVLVSLFGYRMRLSEIFRGVNVARTRIFIGIILVVMASFSGVLGDRIASYITKRSGAVHVSEAYEISRGGLAEQGFENIKNNPLAGIGFGVPSDISTLDITYDPLFGLPISAPIEKGILFVSAAEEIGIPGLFLLLGFFFMALVIAIRSYSPVKLALLFSIIFVNFGEAIFFSPGGTGLLILIMLGWVVRVDARKND